MSGSESSTDHKPADQATQDANSLALAAMERLYGEVDENDEDEDSSALENEVDGDEDAGDADDEDDSEEGESEDEGDDDEEEPEGDEDTDGDDEGQQDAGADRDVGFAKSKRFREMNQELKQLKAERESYQRMQSELDALGISTESLGEAAAVYAALKNPLAPGATKLLQPHLERLTRIGGGGSLDEDLQAELDSGDISEKRARELQALREQQKYRDVAERETTEQRQQRQALEAIDGLYRGFKSADPDFERKQPFLEARAKEMMSEFSQKNGRKPSLSEGTELIKKAKAEIDLLVPARKAPLKPESKVVSGNGKAAKRKPLTSSNDPVEGVSGIKSVIDRVMSRSR